MLSATICAFLFITGLGILLRRMELTGIRLKELSYVGEHSLHIFIYHNFPAFFISKFTGIPLPSDFKEALPAAADHWLSALLAVLCIVLPLGIELISRKLKGIAKKKAAD